eukprot:UN21172
MLWIWLGLNYRCLSSFFFVFPVYPTIISKTQELKFRGILFGTFLCVKFCPKQHGTYCNLLSFLPCHGILVLLVRGSFVSILHLLLYCFGVVYNVVSAGLCSHAERRSS